MTRIAQGDRIARSPGALVHIARVREGSGWTAMCGTEVYHPARVEAFAGPACARCAAIEKRGATL